MCGTVAIIIPNSSKKQPVLSVYLWMCVYVRARSCIGFFMTVTTSISPYSEVAELLTPEFTSATEMCIRFW